MGIRWKRCWDCGQEKRMGKTKKRCAACRRADPSKLRPASGTIRVKKEKSAKKPKKKWQQETYNDRNIILKELGFDSYPDYLKSELWAFVRRSAWAKYGSTCLLCKEKASVLHHFSYTKEVLQGKQLDKLKPLCNECHHKVEFDENDSKRTLLEAQNFFVDLLKKSHTDSNSV